jgi:hypothetical protein
VITHASGDYLDFHAQASTGWYFTLLRLEAYGDFRRSHPAQHGEARGASVAIAQLRFDGEHFSAAQSADARWVAPQHFETGGSDPRDAHLGDRTRYRQTDEQRASPGDHRAAAERDAERAREAARDRKVNG